VLALDLRCGARLARKTRQRFRVDERVGQQELQGNTLVEMQVHRLHHHAHAAPT
jgi:hypothetical protein